jgi:hypothetical protein
MDPGLRRDDGVELREPLLLGWQVCMDVPSTASAMI